MVETEQSSIRATEATCSCSPAPAKAPSPRAAHQRRPSAGAEATPTSTDAVALERDQRAPDRAAADVVAGAVDRVDDPADGAAVVAELLPEDAFTVAVAPDEQPDRLLGGAVGFADRRQVGLRLDLEVERPEAGQRDRVGGVGELVCEAEVGAHGPTLDEGAASTGARLPAPLAPGEGGLEREPGREDESVVAGPPDQLERSRAARPRPVRHGSASAGQPRMLKGKVRRVKRSRTASSSTSALGATKARVGASTRSNGSLAAAIAWRYSRAAIGRVRPPRRR